MDRFSLARMMGHSSPRVTERYYIHVTESHVSTGFEKFVVYQAKKAMEMFPEQTPSVIAFPYVSVRNFSLPTPQDESQIVDGDRCGASDYNVRPSSRHAWASFFVSPSRQSTYWIFRKI
jgi:hypothetical protein